MFKRIRIVVAAVMILFAGNIMAQRIGLLPPRVKWQEIRTDSLRIIFPPGEEDKALSLIHI